MDVSGLSCPRCVDFRAQISLLNKQVEQLERQLANIHSTNAHEDKPDVEADRRHVQSLTGLLSNRDHLVIEQAKTIDKLLVQHTVARAEADAFKQELLNAQSGQRPAFNTFKVEEQTLVAPRAVEAFVREDTPLSASMLGPATSSGAPDLCGIQDRFVPLLSGTARAKIVEHESRGHDSQSASHMRRRAQQEKEGQSGALPNAPPHPVRYDGSPSRERESNPGPGSSTRVGRGGIAIDEPSVPLRFDGRAGSHVQPLPRMRGALTVPVASQGTSRGPTLGASTVKEQGDMMTHVLGGRAMAMVPSGTSTISTGGVQGAGSLPSPSQPPAVRPAVGALGASTVPPAVRSMPTHAPPSAAPIVMSVADMPPATAAAISSDLKFLHNAHAALALAAARAAEASHVDLSGSVSPDFGAVPAPLGPSQSTCVREPSAMRDPLVRALGQGITVGPSHGKSDAIGSPIHAGGWPGLGVGARGGEQMQASTDVDDDETAEQVALITQQIAALRSNISALKEA